jgi:hypothetical protein
MVMSDYTGDTSGDTPDVSPDGNPLPSIRRDKPEPSAGRKELLNAIMDDVRRSRSHWRPVFERMYDDMNFTMGLQWPDSTLWKRNDNYVVNICLRHVQQLTATLYAKNPTVSAKTRKRLLNTVWDGSFQSLQGAMQSLMMNPMDPNAQAIIADAQSVKQTEELLKRMGSTLEIVYNYQIDEQAIPFKKMMKHTVRRAIITGVGYVKVGFQRVTTRDPSGARPVGDMRERMDTAARQIMDYMDGETKPDTAGAADMSLTIQALAAEPEIVIREGLIFDYPDSNMIIPDRRCRHLPSFMGCRRVSEQFMLSVAQIEEIYGIDVSEGYTAYKSVGMVGIDSTNASAGDQAGMQAYVEASVKGGRPSVTGDNKDDSYACVWETYDRSTGLVYVTCDGYCDFLREPASPDVKTDRFWPWFAYLLNETYHIETPYPISDITLIRDMQRDINTAKQGLREHRHAARPKTLVSAGALDDEDKSKLSSHPANAVIELNGLVPGQDAKNLLFPWQGPGIDPNLYETKSAMDDVLRVVGVQEANLGGVSGATATETSIAETSRVSSTDASLDDMDDLLSQIARVASQILLLNVSTEIAQRIAGPGAVWPQASALEVAEEIYLEVKAGSSGRPNQAREVQIMSQIAPILMQVPGVNPEWLARQMLLRLDDRADLGDALAQNIPSIMSINAMAQGGSPSGSAQPNPANEAGSPRVQGPEGASNTPRPGGPGGAGPRPPQPRAEMGPSGPGPLMN